MKKIYIALALHFHQPTGNFEHIFERAHNFCYKPFLELLSEYEEIKMMFHFSGCLFDYLEAKHPETIRIIKNLISRNQIEIMGGGYYEPILTALRERDIVGQIEMMSKYLKHKFNSSPRGIWVAERVWHPRLTKLLYKIGVRYLILDDEHLLRSGIKKENVYGYFLTGEGREKIGVFPSDKKLRYFIPFKLPEETINYLKSVAEKGEKVLLTYGDDGEKFGEWPGTHKWVFEERWLYKFFNALRENKNWIIPIHFSDYLKRNRPTATVIIKEGSYEEMMGWSNNSWLNFLSKYPEAGQMHNKMLYVSSKLEDIEKKVKKSKEMEKAKKELYMGQCNCAYWHGVFGGLYLYHLRQAVYTHLIEADKILDKILYGDKKRWINIRKVNFPTDGKSIVIIESKNFSLCIDAQDGGVIKELDYRPLSLNIMNAISRKKESYHEKILQATQSAAGAVVATIHDDFRTVEPSFKNMLMYDRLIRSCFRSYLLKDDLRLEDLISSKYEELGDFSRGVYKLKKKDKGIVLERESRVGDTTLKLSKEIEISSEKNLKFTSCLENKSSLEFKGLFGTEFNVTMPYLNSERYRYISDRKEESDLNKEGQSNPISSFGISDTAGELNTSFRFSEKPQSVLYFPVKTISQSERAYEMNYQCSCIFFIWNLELKKDSKRSFNVEFTLEKSPHGSTKK